MIEKYHPRVDHTIRNIHDGIHYRIESNYRGDEWIVTDEEGWDYYMFEHHMQYVPRHRVEE